MKEYIKLISLKRSKFKKCECCEKVQELYYEAMIFDYDNPALLVGSIALCKLCGQNLNRIMGNEYDPGTKVIKEFSFGGPKRIDNG